MFCSKCGTQLNEDAKFCNNCGERLGTQENHANPINDLSTMANNIDYSEVTRFYSVYFSINNYIMYILLFLLA